MKQKCKKFMYLIRTADADAIGVKKQKNKRVNGYEKSQKTVQTDVIEV
jgi:hypothetical protein